MHAGIVQTTLARNFSSFSEIAVAQQLVCCILGALQIESLSVFSFLHWLPGNSESNSLLHQAAQRTYGIYFDLCFTSGWSSLSPPSFPRPLINHMGLCVFHKALQILFL